MISAKNNDEKVKSSKKNFILALILLLSTNIIMGVVLMSLSKNSLSSQIYSHMLDVSNMAAYQLDGDVMRDIKAEDIGSEKYNKALEILRSYQQTIQLDYIYAVRSDNDGTFSFTIDPDPDAPGAFGESIETTQALINASNGTADVDHVPHTDEWGRFYSAYSPILDSNGNVAGIVGVDFNADWFDAKLNSNRAVAVILTIVAMTIGIILSFIMMSNNRKRFDEMLRNLSELDLVTLKLDSMIMKSSIKKLDFLPNSESKVLKTLASGEQGTRVVRNEYDEVSSSIESVYEKLNKYLKYLDSEVYTDNMTGVSNKAAYRKTVNSIGEKIKEGKAVFTIGYFDINEITNIYTIYGYEAGDMVMYETAKVLMNVYGKENVFHITGDEYIVIVEDGDAEKMEYYFRKFEEGIEKYNTEHNSQNRITVGKGYVIYEKDKYPDYRSAFIAAKKRCDEDKAEYFKRKTQPNE